MKSRGDSQPQTVTRLHTLAEVQTTATCLEQPKGGRERSRPPFSCIALFYGVQTATAKIVDIHLFLFILPHLLPQEL